MLRLVEPNIECKQLFLDFAQQIEVNEEAKKERIDFALRDFEGYVQERLDWSRGRNLPEHFVPNHEYWLLDQEKGIVAYGSLRHRLNDHLRTVGGHIGYYVSPKWRRKGYGTEILRLTLQKAKALGLSRVLVTCDEDNIASAKIIEKNGGLFENHYQEDEQATPKRRYWITLE